MKKPHVQSSVSTKFDECCGSFWHGFEYLQCRSRGLSTHKGTSAREEKHGGNKVI